MNKAQLQKKLIHILGIGISLVVLYIIFIKFINPYLPWEPDASLNPDPNHIHADFSIWIDGYQVNFEDNKYMSGVSYDDSSHDEAGEYLHPYLHLHDNVGHVLHRHKPELTFGEFINSIGYSMTESCIATDAGAEYCNKSGLEKWTMIINGVPTRLDPDYEFSDLDKILLSYGSDDEAVRKQFKKMTDDACLYSQACPWRGDPPAENCIADPAVPCVADLEDDFS